MSSLIKKGEETDTMHLYVPESPSVTESMVNMVSARVGLFATLKMDPSGPMRVTVTVPWRFGGTAELQSITRGSPIVALRGVDVNIVSGSGTGGQKNTCTCDLC